MKAWKELEKAVAKKLGGKRVVRVGFHDSAVDVEHPYYSIECKYGKQVPKYLDVSMGTMLITKDRTYCLIPSKDLIVTDNKISSLSFFLVLSTRRPGATFVERGLAQAAKYSKKAPVLCVKRPGMRGFVLVREYEQHGWCMVVDRSREYEHGW